MSQNRFFLNLLKRLVMNFYWVCTSWYVLAQIRYLSKFNFVKYGPKCSQTIILKDCSINHVSRTNLWNWIGWLAFFQFWHCVRNPCSVVDHIVGLYAKTFLAAEIWEIRQKHEFFDLLKTLVVDTYPEKLKFDQKCFSWVWGMNRMNKLSWIKLVSYRLLSWFVIVQLKQELVGFLALLRLCSSLVLLSCFFSF